MIIKVEGMEFFAYHGLLEEESRIGGRFIVDLEISTDFSSAAEKDDINGTVDYSEVYDLVKKEMEISSRLIEHLAKRIKDSILSNVKGVEYLQVKVSKLRPPVNGVIEKVSVIF